MSNKKKILCYGDSNTWGYSPEAGDRYSQNVRWPGVLASLLGDDYLVIEEGLNGRTTDLEDTDRIGRNGYTYLVPCMDAHYPVNYVVLCLGTNDAKSKFDRSAEGIASGIENLVQVILGENLEDPSPDVKVILVAPPPVREVGAYAQGMEGAAQKMTELAPLCRAIAEKYGLSFVDLSSIEPSLKDGIHLSAKSHAQVAKLIFEKISR